MMTNTFTIRRIQQKTTDITKQAINEGIHKNHYICSNIMTSYLNNQMIDSDTDLTPQSVTTSYVEDDLADLRPPAIFKKTYRELSPYEESSFAGVTLKKTKNGQRAKSGISLACPISPSSKRQSW
jgi:hypothetical protein